MDYEVKEEGMPTYEQWLSEFTNWGAFKKQTFTRYRRFKFHKPNVSMFIC